MTTLLPGRVVGAYGRQDGSLGREPLFWWEQRWWSYGGGWTDGNAFRKEEKRRDVLQMSQAKA